MTSKAPLKPVIARARGRPRGSVAVQQPQPHQRNSGIAGTRREPSQFEHVQREEAAQATAAWPEQQPPPSTAPAAISEERRHLTSTDVGLNHLQRKQFDAYEPGTMPPRAYQRAIQENLPEPETAVTASNSAGNARTAAEVKFDNGFEGILEPLAHELEAQAQAVIAAMEEAAAFEREWAAAVENKNTSSAA